MQVPLRPLLVTVSFLAGACKPVGIADQAQLSRPVFDFDGGGVRSYECGLSRQIETGRSDSSTVSAGGCASCQ